MPPLDCLLFFEAAARKGSFKKAAEELCVTTAAVAYRIKTLEAYFHRPLFVRHSRGVELNRHGQEYLQAIQRLLSELHEVSERHRNLPTTNRLAIVAVEVLAEKWLIPKLAEFKAIHPDIAIELETDHREVDMAGRGLDIWLPYANEVRAPLQAEILLEEHLVPVCSPILLETRGRPAKPADLLTWPLLYDIEWAADWSCWFEHQGRPSPDLSRASGFRLYSMLVQAAVEGMGGRHGPHRNDCAGAETGNPGAAIRPEGPRARPLSAGDHAGFQTQTRGPGVQRLDIEAAGRCVPRARTFASQNCLALERGVS